MSFNGKAGRKALLRNPARSANVLARDTSPRKSVSLPSLLWQDATQSKRGLRLPSSVAADLALDRIVSALNVDGRYERNIREVLYELCTDPALVSYRQDVLADLQGDVELARQLRALLPELAALSGRNRGWKGDSPMMGVLDRLSELDTYVRCVDSLRGILDRSQSLRSEGLLALRRGVVALAEDPEVVSLRAELPKLHELVAETTSVTIGMNLGAGLQPESATITALNRYQFKGPRSLLGRLLPGGAGGKIGQTPLREVGPINLRRGSQLFKDLQDLLESATAPLARALDQYREVNVSALAALQGELAFFTGAVALVERLQAVGVATCRPEIIAAQERSFKVRDLANLSLCLQLSATDGEQIVTNDADFDAESRLLILTGPNRGGKTTYCRALGQAQVMFQCGLFVVASSASISPVDGIRTHFPLPEADQPGAGRLDEEVQRLRRIFDEATGDSLILLNEPLTSTSERGALTIATDLVRALQLLGARVLLVTHLHDLAQAIPELNASGPKGSGVRSLVAETMAEGEIMRGTFRIVPGVPVGRSYAADIARQHGLTFEQLRHVLAERTSEPLLSPQYVPEPQRNEA